jgi:hypothetical protein
MPHDPPPGVSWKILGLVSPEHGSGFPFVSFIYVVARSDFWCVSVLLMHLQESNMGGSLVKHA